MSEQQPPRQNDKPLLAGLKWMSGVDQFARSTPRGNQHEIKSFDFPREGGQVGPLTIRRKREKMALSAMKQINQDKCRRRSNARGGARRGSGRQKGR